MRLARLDLLAYGKFTNRSVALPARVPDLHLVVGDNEAGKSTALEAIKDLLFGMPPQTPYGFAHGYKDMLLGGVVAGAGADMVLRRRKGTRETLRDGDDRTVADSVLAGLLGGADRAFVERMFALDHDRLRAGADDMLRPDSDAGRTLFAAGAGLETLSAELTRLREEADGLFGARRSEKRAFFPALDALGAAKDAIKAATVRRDDWKARRDAVEALSSDARAAEADHAGLRADLTAVQRLRRLRPAALEWRRACEALADRPAGAILAADAAATLESAAREIEDCDVALAGLDARDRRDRDTLASLAVDAGVLREAATIEALTAERAQVRGFEEDLPKRKERVATLAAQLVGQLREVGWPDADAAALEARLPRAIDLNRVRALAKDHARLAAEMKTARQGLDRARATVEDAARDLAGLAEPIDPRPLRVALKVARERQATLAAGRDPSAVKQAERRLVQAIAALTPWSGDHAALRVLTAPALAAIDDARRVADDLQRARETHAGDSERLAATLAVANERRRHLARTERVVSAEELSQARTVRDATWHSLRDHLVAGHAIDAALPAAFETELATADELADRRFDRAHAAAQLAQIDNEIAGNEARAAELAATARTLAAREVESDAAWRALWAPVGLDPDSPARMADWPRRLEAAQGALAALDQLRDRAEAVAVESAAALAALAIALESAGHAARVADLASAIETGEQLTLDIGRADTQRTTLGERRRSAVAEATRHAGGLADIEQALSGWRAGWNAALASIGLAETTTPERSDDHIGALDAVRATVVEILDIRRQRIETMRRDIDAFAARTAVLAGIVGGDLSLAPDRRAADFDRRLKEARAGHVTRLQIERGLTDIAKDRVAAAERKAGALIRLQSLFEATGVDTLPALREAVADSDRRRALVATRDTAAAALGGDRDGTPIELFAAACVAEDEPTLAAREAELGARGLPLDERRRDLAVALASARRELAAVSAGADAAKAEADRQMALTDIRDIAERYARARTASTLLDWAIEKYRREKQDPLLKRAGELFAMLTRGSFVALDVARDDKGVPRLAGLRPGEVRRSVELDGMSEGTRDQLYLALRVAAVEDHLGRATPLPFVADDLFGNFDDDRAGAGLRVLAELAKRTQVLVFTHHRHLVDVARRELGADGFGFTEL